MGGGRNANSHGNHSSDVGGHVTRQLVGTDPAKLIAVVIAKKTRVLAPAENAHNAHRVVREAAASATAPIRGHVEHASQAEAHPNSNLRGNQRHVSVLCVLQETFSRGLEEYDDLKKKKQKDGKQSKKCLNDQLPKVVHVLICLSRLCDEYTFFQRLASSRERKEGKGKWLLCSQLC